MNVLMAANTEGHIFYMDSLAFPRSHLQGNDPAKRYIPFAARQRHSGPQIETGVGRRVRLPLLGSSPMQTFSQTGLP